MGHGHGHGHAPDIAVGRTPRTVLIGFLILIGVATAISAFILWPHEPRQPIPYAAPGAREVTGVVAKVGDPCPVIDSADAQAEGRLKPMPEGCNQLIVRVEGKAVSAQAPPYAVRSGLRPGDQVKLLRVVTDAQTEPAYAFVSAVRTVPLLIVAGLFVLVVAVVARWRGLLALVGLIAAGAVIGVFMLPALLAGESAVAVALVASTAIMYVVLYLAHGVSLRTSAALAGTLAGVAITALVGIISVGSMRLSGISDDKGEMLLTHASSLDFRGLLGAGIVLAGLGVLNDVTITQASSVWELRAAGPHLTRWQLYRSGMRIGRDHIASTIYTIVFAYSGTAILLLLLFSLYDRSWLALVTSDQITEEIVRTLASAIGLVLAVPATTGIAALTVGGANAHEGAAPARSAKGGRRAAR